MGQRSRKRARTAAPSTTSMRERYARAEARNAEVRAGLEPLAPGERPTAVTVAAIVATVGAAALIIGYATGLLEHRSDRAPAVTSSVVILAVAAYGLWRARYWAVLGFQAILALNILVMALLLIRASSLVGVAIALAVVVLAGWLFWKLVRAMARIQMPVRRPPA